MLVLAFDVEGTPKPKGSMVGHTITRGDGSLVTDASGRPFVSMHETRNRNRDWRKDVKRAAAKAKAAAALSMIEVPVVLEVIFRFARPASHHRSADRDRPLRADAPRWVTAHNKGDLGKLLRTIEDELTDAKVWTDDALVVSYGGSSKVWADADGATIRVLLADPPAPVLL